MGYFASNQTKARPLSQQQLDIKRLHWSKYLEKYPLRNAKVWDNPSGDNDNYIDNWDANDEPKDNQ